MMKRSRLLRRAKSMKARMMKKVILMSRAKMKKVKSMRSPKESLLEEGEEYEGEDDEEGDIDES